jgi:hypothetical protein
VRQKCATHRLTEAMAGGGGRRTQVGQKCQLGAGMKFDAIPVFSSVSIRAYIFSARLDLRAVRFFL